VKGAASRTRRVRLDTVGDDVSRFRVGVVGVRLILMRRRGTLNVRHSLSTALVACLGMGLVNAGVRNVNQLVHQEVWDIVEYVRGEHFKRLLR